MKCQEYRPDHNGECLNCDEPADAHGLLTDGVGNGGQMEDDYRNPVMFALGQCYGCKRMFSFNPHLVPSFRIGPDGKPHPDGPREPICESCFHRFNQRRIAAGLEPIRLLPGAYDPEPLR